MKPETRHLLAYLDRVEPALDKLTHFELLDLQPDASEDAIQRAYHEVAGRMHPDRHRSELSREQYDRLNIVYGRITEAYRVLRDGRERETYVKNLLRDGGAENVGGDEKSALKLLSPKAQRLYRRAKAALRTGDKTSAVLNLKMALRGHPNSALLKQALSDAMRR
jgi:curved DNA-binding protein CbpA